MRCNFCMNAGLQNTFHPMRSAFGVVICPILKETVCSNCNEKGHTPKYCEKETTRIQFTPQSLYVPIASTLNPNATEFYPNLVETPFSYLMNPYHSPTLAEYQKRRAYLSQTEKEEVRRRIANDFEAFVRTTPFGQHS